MSGIYPHLSRAPIREAVLDIRVELPASFALEQLAPFTDLLSASFPEVRPIHTISANFAIGDKAPEISSAPPRIVGHIHWTQDKSRAVQGRLDGFTVNHVNSYKDWESLRLQAQELWRLYADVAHPVRVVRIALRYVNRLELLADAPLERSLRTLPKINSALPQHPTNHFMRLVLPFPESRQVVLTQATEDVDLLGNGMHEAGNSVGLLLDLDAFVSRSFDPRSSDMWAEFEQLREIKNLCFFESLTPEALERYR
ncbi:TIGR04255 family protein [Polyangium fumosum]|nr:TIGR04255 family protein [Polyangium fumosum]